MSRTNSSQGIRLHQRSVTRAVTVLFAVLAACSDPATSPSGSGRSTSPSPEARHLLTTGDFDMNLLIATYPDNYSVDSADANYGPLFFSGESGVGGCRDHFSGISLWWNSPNGIVAFDLHPILLFVSYRGGTFAGAAKAIYETTAPDVDGTDQAGNIYRFGGRFNALCKNLDRYIGPIMIQAQVLTAQNPIDQPRLIYSPGGGAGGCLSYEDQEVIYDPNSEPQDRCSGGGGGGGSNQGLTCEQQWIIVEIDYGDGVWHVYWEGYAKVCE